MNLLIWLAALWLMGVLGKWLWGVSPLLGWVYAICMAVGLGSYFYIHGVVYLLRKVRQIDEERARAEIPTMWTAWRIAHVSLFGFCFSLYTTMYGLPRWHRFRLKGSGGGKRIGVETRYFSVSIGRE
jgi:hypothetical protein